MLQRLLPMISNVRDGDIDGAPTLGLLRLPRHGIIRSWLMDSLGAGKTAKLTGQSQ